MDPGKSAEAGSARAEREAEAGPLRNTSGVLISGWETVAMADDFQRHVQRGFCLQPFKAPWFRNQ